MGNSDSKAIAGSSSHGGRSHRRRSLTKNNPREQLRAKSFLKREQEGEALLKDDAPFERKYAAEDDILASEEMDQNALIQQLQDNIRRLSAKCSALESQNILVAVQQLDWLVFSLSWGLSVSVLYYYWKFLSWGLPLLPWNQVRQWMQETQMDAEAILPARFYYVALSVLKAFLWVIPYFYNKFTHGSFHRRTQVFAVAFIVIGRIKLCRWREHVFLQQDAPTDDVQPFGEACTNDGIWEANYEISARFLYLSVKRLRGLWTKSAQYLSSRADFMPLGYIRELSKLQDQAPETPWQDIQHLLPVKLKRDLLKIDTKPIASASIGQVHLAQMMVNGQERKVVIKVQHPHARTLMLDDFWSLLVICRIVGWLEPDYAFMEILMREWAFEARKELDFTNELEHLQQAQDALVAMFPAKESVVYTNTEHRTPFRAEVPKPIAQYSSPNVLVMDYCEGCRVDNFSQLEKWSLNRVDVMDGLSQTFAHFMYCSEIFNGDPHPGNFLIRQGANSKLEEEGFTLVLLDWGLAKKLPVKKRTAFCQMVYAAATLDYGLLLDSYKTMGLKMKREDAGQSMEDMRFFLRDMAPRTQARRAIKSKIKQGQALATRNKEKVPMESKAYPGELFFFIRVTELLHGLGSKMDADLRYLETIRPYAEKGLRHLLCPETEDAKFEKTVTSSPVLPNAPDLQKNLTAVLEDFENEGQFIGGQICVLDKNGKVEVDVFAGTLGGLKDHIDMKRDSLILGYSCTKAITATLAHRMVEEGYLSLDEPISKRVWKNFCPTQVVPSGLARSMELSAAEAELRWKWKRQITLRHILNHTAGLWAAFPPNLTIKSMASCETCFPAFEYNPSAPEKTILPSRMPGEKSEYHFMSFGWLVAGTVCGAYALKHKKHNATYEEVYNAILFPKLSQSIKDLGFCPLGAHRDQNSDMLANTVTSDVRASEMMQKQRERSLMGDEENAMDSTMREMMKTFHGVEFLLDPRIWNSRDALSANVPAAGGRFSAAALAQFYHELGNVQSLLSASTLKDLVQSLPPETSTSAMQGVTRIANDTSNQRTRLSLGFQLIQTERDKENVYSGLGHAGVGGSIGFWHRPSGLSISLMLNKADGEVEATTMKILRTIGDYYNI